MADIFSPSRLGGTSRAVALASACLSILLVLYLMFFADLYRRPDATESQVAQTLEGRPPLDIHIEMMSLDPIRQTVEARLNFPQRRADAAQAGEARVRLSDGGFVRELRLPADRAAGATSVEFGLDGSISAYPFDVYRTDALIAAFAGEGAQETPLAVQLTVWERLPAWEARVVSRPARPGEVGLPISIEARRPPAHVVFALIVYAVMAVIAACGLAIGVLVACGVRKIEAAFAGSLAGMLFAAPMLRNAMPGAPPLGVAADAYVFLWVQVALMVGLVLFVCAWARRGSPP